MVLYFTVHLFAYQSHILCFSFGTEYTLMTIILYIHFLKNLYQWGIKFIMENYLYDIEFLYVEHFHDEFTNQSI